MKKIIIEVQDEIYTDPNTSYEKDGKWVPATPEPYPPTILENIAHALGQHISFGQPYCVICLKKEKL